ncbi:putative mitogen-activated protein kinase [Leptomonas seymouri]|uniref:cyclin-dependent kinase n=1 Tax=Leptomonas seymouri TaxID=5684 RepID=A0A0N1I0V8_LEPSE|nr:putative mitogen-activated protein kinase [Leptomonas seymouri]|eukprot:KPI84550.1 putative mitogen-activated protein kinase [Leptomonas seymouri]
MENYEVLGILGEGTYGVVMKARSRTTGKLVAIKRFKQTDEDDHVRKTSTREVRMLQQLKHPNVVRLEDVFRREGKLYLVFEYIENTILQVLENTTHGIPPRELRRYTYQLLRGIEFCHAHHVIHRDVKPENVLIDQSGMLKLCDFGFARQMTSKGKYTDYVATRWYRAPELLVGDVSYGRPVDVWALGCMFAELSDGQPLFSGESDLDQLCLIIQTCGPLPSRMVSIFEHNPLYRNVSYPHASIVYTLQERYHRQPADWLGFLYACLNPDPAKRLTCTELMALPYFTRDGFRDRYEQELRAKSGLPLLCTNPTASAPLPTRRPMAEKTHGKSKNILDAPAAVTTNSGIETAAPPSKEAHPAMNPKNDIDEGSSMEVGKPKTVGGNTGSFLPAVVSPSSVALEGTVQLPLILNQNTSKNASIAQDEGVSQNFPAPHRHNTLIPPSKVASPTSHEGGFTVLEAPVGKTFSQSLSAVLPSRRISSVSSIATSPLKKTDTGAIEGSIYPESDQRPINTVDNRGKEEVDRRSTAALAAAQLANPSEATAANAVGAGATSDHESGRASRSLHSLYSNASPQSSSLHSARGEAKPGLSDAAPSLSVSSPSIITDVALKTANVQPPPSQRPHLASLADRLPDLTSPKLHLLTHKKQSNADTDEPLKCPLQQSYGASPTSFNDSTASQTFINPLATRNSQDKGNIKHALPRTRRSGPPDTGAVPHLYSTKRLTKRKKESLVQRGSCSSCSRSIPECNLPEQVLDALRTHRVSRHASHDGMEQGSDSVNNFKLSTTRSFSQAADSLRLHDLHEEEPFGNTQGEEKVSRARGKLSDSSTPRTTASRKRCVDIRGSIPRKERRSKPLHALAHTTSHGSEGPKCTSPRQQLETLLQSESINAAQQASTTLLALSALRDSTASLHHPPTQGGAQTERYSFSRHAQAVTNGAHCVIPSLAKSQAKEGGSMLPVKRATNRSRKPLGIYTLQSTRRSLDDDDGGSSTLRMGDTKALASLPTGQIGGFAIPYHRISKAGVNGGVSPTTSGATTTTPLPPSSKKPRKGRPSVSDDLNGAGGSDVAPCTNGHQKDLQSSPAPTSTTSTMEQSAPQWRDTGEANRKLLPFTYNAATATATQR